MSLASSHVVIVSGNAQERAQISDLIRAADGIPHASENRTQALGMLLELYRLRIIPRAMVVAWNLCPPVSVEQRFYELLGMPEETTAYSLVKHARNFDRHLAILVLENGPSGIKPGAEAKYEFRVLPWPAQDSILVMRLLEDPRMADMKAAAHLRKQTEEFDSGRRSSDDSGSNPIVPMSGSRT